MSGTNHLELPPPSLAEAAQSRHLEQTMAEEMSRSGGSMDFARFMELALYAPGLGYYVAGARKLGREGDFVTAPEISALFSRCIARQVHQVLAALGGGVVLEFGAGSGELAVQMLAELEALGRPASRYSGRPAAVDNTVDKFTAPQALAAPWSWEVLRQSVHSAK